jgi:hypothetical protein
VRSVWKFELLLSRGNALYEAGGMVVPMPTGAEVIHVGTQEGRLYIWAIVDTIELMWPRKFLLAWTGQPIPSLYKHLGSVQIDELIWHVFEEVQDDQ